ncbi:peptidylprolyl isomerase [Synechococcus sp. UW140]|uniref:peptidylprolyl isomerase n=1 Tax=Synechococcus sp. UW140 TaxID=368503 RepID=UPI000E0F5517|nr:peptidylprolyl isomerase [Synechococcus sp. UW140]
MARRSLWASCLATLLCLPLLVGCNPATNASVPIGCAQASSPCLKGKATVLLTTSRGEITLELDGDAAPVTAGNFVDLVRRGVYNGTVFHRVVREPVPFVVQGGDPASKDPNTAKAAYGSGSFIDPASGQARYIPLEVKFKKEDQPRYGRVTSNPSDLLQIELAHDRGALAMARSQAPDSASAQFYIALRPLPELDGRYAVFGRVVQGMEVVDAIQADDRITKAALLTPTP